LREQLKEAQEESRRKDAILLNMTEAMKALNPPPDTPSEPRDGREAASSASGGDGVPSEQEKRSWWQRLFLG
jgi:hypothetical protein